MSKEKVRLARNLFGLIIIFCIDMLVPLGAAVGVLYVVSISLILGSPRREILAAAVISSFLILLAFYLLRNDSTSWMVYVNRGVSLLAIWFCAYVAIRHKNLATERKIHIRKLEQQNKELEQYTYIASHDLQEPLRTVTSFSKILNEEYHEQLDELGKQSLGFIQQATTRMQNLVKSLLDYSRVGKSKEKTLVDCEQLLKEVQGDLATRIRETNALLDIGKLPKVMGYPVDLRVLFQNLLENGMKFHQKDQSPRLKISAAQNDNYWKFSVADNGIGIKENHQEKVFQIFKRLHAAEDYSGTGIGLAHCQKIVLLHGGEIWLESEPCKGSTFYFTIPK